MQIFVLHENIRVKGQRIKKGKIIDGMTNITSTWLFPRWFQHDISMVSINKEVSCFTHKPLRVYY